MAKEEEKEEEEEAAWSDAKTRFLRGNHTVKLRWHRSARSPSRRSLGRSVGRVVAGRMSYVLCVCRSTRELRPAKKKVIWLKHGSDRFSAVHANYAE